MVPALSEQKGISHMRMMHSDKARKFLQSISKFLRPIEFTVEYKEQQDYFKRQQEFFERLSREQHARVIPLPPKCGKCGWKYLERDSLFTITCPRCEAILGHHGWV